MNAVCMQDYCYFCVYVFVGGYGRVWAGWVPVQCNKRQVSQSVQEKKREREKRTTNQETIERGPLTAKEHERETPFLLSCFNNY